MFLLIELFLKLLFLPFKLLFELLELLARSQHHSRRSHRGRRTSRTHQTATRNTNAASNNRAGWFVVLGIAGSVLVCVLISAMINNPRAALPVLLVVAAVIIGVLVCVWLVRRDQSPAVRPKAAGTICNTEGLDPTFFHGVGVGHRCRLPVPHQRHLCRCGGSWSDTDYLPQTM